MNDNNFVYASFLQRMAAIIIDAIVLFIPQAALGSLFGFLFINRFGYTDPTMILIGYQLWFWIASTVIAWIYFATMESSPTQATIGKRVLGLTVADIGGNRISFNKATCRFASKAISLITFGIGYLAMLGTPRNQCLHDMMSKCIVLYRRDSSTTESHVETTTNRADNQRKPITNYIRSLRPKHLALMCAVVIAIIASGIYGLGVLYSNVVWRSETADGKYDRMDVCFLKNGNYMLFRGVYKLKYREGKELRLWKSPYGKTPDLILSNVSDLQLFREGSPFGLIRSGVLINLAHENKAREKAEQDRQQQIADSQKFREMEEEKAQKYREMQAEKELIMHRWLYNQ